jgi:hypothetical protein
MGSANCNEPGCDKLVTFDFVPRSGIFCFKHKIRSINLGFSHGKNNFHGDTKNQKAEQQERDMKAAGINYERLPEKATW